MSFCESVKKEIIDKPIKERHCRKAFLAGLIRGASSLYYGEEGIGLIVKVYDEGVANLIFNLFKSLFNYEIRNISVSQTGINKKSIYSLLIDGEKTTEMLKELEVIEEKNGELSINFNYFGELTKNECCLHSFFRGLFVAVGSCTVPQESKRGNTGYHLSMTFSRSDTASSVINKMVEVNLSAKIMRVKENFVLYIKSAEGIKDFLAFLNTPIAVLKLTDLIIEKEILNDTNRRKNCDLGNVNKQVEASAKQKIAIERIQKTIGFESLKNDLRIVAECRLKYPEDTLLELAERLNITKSCLNHRLRKIVSISNEIEEK